MFCFGSCGERPVGVLLVLHEDEVPELEEALAARAARLAVRLAAAGLRAPVVVDLGVGAARARARRPTRSSPTTAAATIRSTGMPIFFQRSIATSSGPSFSSGSPAWTLTQMRSQSSFSRSWMNSVAYSIAPSLKYWPNEKLPSISKKVRWYVSSPTSSMSGVRKHFCAVVVSRRRRRLAPEEVRHLRLHARDGEERRAVVRARDERRRGTAQMALLLEEGEEALADLVRRAHRAAIVGGRPPGREIAAQRRRIVLCRRAAAPGSAIATACAG